LSDLHETALESVDVGILVFGARGRLAYANPAAEEILQVSAQALLGRTARTLFRGCPAALALLRRAQREKAPLTAFDVTLRVPAVPSAASQKTVTAVLGAAPLAGRGGGRGGLVVSLRSAEILGLVGRGEEAARSAEELQMLASGLAHEIRNPLGGIRGAAQWLLRGEGSPAERREGLELILRETARINGLVEKMLEASRTPAPSRPFSLLPILGDVARLLAAEARDRPRVRVELAVDPSLPEAVGDGDTVFRALLNVARNALEAVGDEGTVRVEARLHLGYRFGAGRAGTRPFIEITVSDTGPGMTAEEVRKAVLPFYTTKPGGTGLGLVVARQAAARHGGRLEIRSTPGQGTAVTISLPAAPGRSRGVS